MKNLLIARFGNLNDRSKIRVLLENRDWRGGLASRIGLTAPEQTSMLVCRGEVREFGLTGLTRNQVSLTAPGVRIPPSPPSSLACFPTLWRSDEIGAWGANNARPCKRRLPTAAPNADSRPFVSVAMEFGATTKR